MRVALIATAAACLAACSPAPSRDTATSSSAAISSSAAAPVIAVTTTSLPVAFQGKWDAPPKPCSTPYRSDMQLDITATELTYFESGGTVKSVKVNGPHDVVAEVDMSGEGEEWHKSLHMTLSDDGKTLTLDDGKMGVRVRCS